MIFTSRCIFDPFNFDFVSNLGFPSAPPSKLPHGAINVGLGAQQIPWKFLNIQPLTISLNSAGMQPRPQVNDTPPKSPGE